MHPTSTRRRIAAVVVAAATTMTMLTVTPRAEGQTVGILRTGENYRLGNPPQSRVRDVPGLASSPSDARQIVEVERDVLAFNCIANVSLDGGVTWSGGPLVPPDGFQPPNSPIDKPSCTSFEGSVAWGSGNRVYVAWAAGKADGTSQTIVSRSADSGRTWSPVVANAGQSNGPELAVCPAGRAGCPAGSDRVVLMAQGNVTIQSTAFARIFVNVSDTNGDAGTWSAPVDASGAVNLATTALCSASSTCLSRAEPSAPVVMSDGSVAVSYRVPDPNPQGGLTAVTSTIQIGRSANGLAPWSQVNVTPVRGYVDEASQRFNGSNFPRMAGDPRNQNLYIVYMEGPPPGGRQDHFIHPDVDTMFTRSLDGGLTWSAPKRLNDDPPGSGAPATGPAQRHPKASVAPDGRVDVVWQDRRNGYRSPTHSHLGNGEARMGDTYYTFSLDAGANFSPNRRISDKSQNLDIGYDHYGQEYWNWGPALTELGNDNILFAWQDSREGNFDNESVDIYLANTSVRAQDVIPVQRLPETSRSSLSVALSKYAYTGGPQAVLNIGFTNRAVTRPVIVNEGDALGALAGAVLSRAHLGPLLASPATGLTPELKAEVTRMSPIGAFVIGGESALTPAVVSNLVAAGVPEAEIFRYAGSPAEVAKTMALNMDRRTSDQKTAGAPAFDAVVIVNPASQEAFAAAGMAASLRLPILFTDGRDSLPTATRDALAALNITTSLVIGNSGIISDAVAASLPGAKRLGGANLAEVTQSVLAESKLRRLPLNIVHVADSDQPFDDALMASAVARTGGLMVVTPGADTAQAEARLAAVDLRNTVDRLVVARSLPALSGPGYRLVAKDGGIFAFGGAGFFGSTGALKLAQPMVGMANTPSNLGYWMVAADGGVFAFGDAAFKGSTGAIKLAQPMVGMAPTPSGNGYWLVAKDGGVFAFGDARFFGSMGATKLAQPVVGIAASPSGKGYWLVAADGGVFAFGDAAFKGSTGAIKLAKPVVGMSATGSGNGYWMVASDGGVFAFGDAPFKGSTGAIKLAQPMVAMDATASGNGYFLTAADGGVFAFGDARFAGSTGGMKLNQPVVGLSAGGG
ncbi:MAG TPA: sialidase family protein [Acidimicrobiales bacterium]|nr:sialidase family protein [Acidimicrobiales bacterium]